MDVFKFGEAKDKGGHLKVAGNTVEFADPQIVSSLRSLFDVEEEGLIGRTFGAAEAANLINEAISDQLSLSSNQALLEALVAMRRCAMNSDPSQEFGISLI